MRAFAWLLLACFALPGCDALLPAVPMLTGSILPGVSDDLQLSASSSAQPPAGSYHKALVAGSGNAALGFVIAEERATRKARRREKLGNIALAAATVLSLASLGY